MRRTTPEKVIAPIACRECGIVLDNATRKYCDDCLPTYEVEAIATFSARGRTRLAEHRHAGNDPSHGGDAGKRRGVKTAQRKRELAAWEAEHGNAHTDSLMFTAEILPHLQQVSLGTMAKATGLSMQYCSLIRRGQKFPHRRHWDALKALTDLGRDENA
jgi:hypothetical protein